MTADAARHIVSFYVTDAKLVADLVPFIGEGLRAGEPAVLLATHRHLDALFGALQAEGLPVAELLEDGMITALDAAETLSALVVDGVPDRNRFRSVITPVLRSAAGRGPRVRAFGEMVDLLWEAGQVVGALALEGLWGEVLTDERLSLWCAYRASSVADSKLADVAHVCAHHSDVVAPPAFASARTDAPDDIADQSRLFLPTLVAARAVRRFVTDSLSAWHADHLVHDAALVASELASNALLHASSPFRVFLRRSADDITIAVHDTSATVPTPRPAEDFASNGRGVAIVDTLASSWGTELRPDGGKIVWATLSAGAA